MSCRTSNGSADAEVSLWIEYDQVLRGGNTLAIDISAMNSDGFQITVDAIDAAEPNNAWWGYMTFGDAPAAGSRTTKNTRSFPLGVDVGMGWRM